MAENTGPMLVGLVVIVLACISMFAGTHAIW